MRYDVRTLALIAAIASAGLSFAAPAAAAPAPSSATLADPARTANMVTVAGVWQCAGTTCTGMANPLLREAVAACTDVADHAGHVVAFTAGSYNFADADLMRCNRHAKDK